MKRFTIKFCILFLLIDGAICWYAFWVQPNISGDMGRLAQIPFGMEYQNKLKMIHQHDKQYVYNYCPNDPISNPIITIGDSYSRQMMHGYQQFLGEMMGCNILNVNHENSPEQTFIQLVNNNLIPKGTTVIIESVERGLIYRFSHVDYEDRSMPEIWNTCQWDIDYSTLYETDKIEALLLDIDNDKAQKYDIIKGLTLKIKLLLGIKNPINIFTTTSNLFSHSRYKNKLYIYDSPWDQDGDLWFVNNQVDWHIDFVYNKITELHKFATDNGIKLIYIIAANKYDVYEQYISQKHHHNTMLDYCPNEPWLINTKQLFIPQIESGVKDIYYIHDSHWSPIGAKIVAESLYNRLGIK